MITPDEIREVKIRTVTQGGYDIDEVNELLDNISDSYAAVYEENKELFRKMEILAAKIEEYRDEEDSIKTALIVAQKTADKIKTEATTNAEEAISKSTASAQRVVSDAKSKAEKLLSDAKAYVENFTSEKTTQASTIINEAEAKANEAINGANVVAKDIIDQAKGLSNELITKAREEKEFHEALVSKLKSETTTFRENLISLYETQLEGLKDPRILASKVVSEKAEAEENIAETHKEVKLIIDEMKDVEISVAASQPKYEVENTDSSAFDVAPEENGISDIAANTVNEEKPVMEDVYSNETDEAAEPIVASAIESFTADELTPVNEKSTGITEISEDAEMDEVNQELPFESFLSNNSNVEPKQRTKETISLIPPEDDEDEENNDKKFKGFFKKKK